MRAAPRAGADSFDSSSGVPQSQVLLLTDAIRLGQPCAEVRVDVAEVTNAERVNMVARRDSFDPAKPRMLQTPRQDDVTIEPLAARRNLRERHADLERDAGLLGLHAYRSELSQRHEYSIKKLSNPRFLSFKVALERVTPARMCLAPVGESASA